VCSPVTQAQILKHLLIQDATFQIVPLAHWDASTSSVTRMELSAAQKQAVGKLHELGASKRAGNGSRAKKPKGVLLSDPNAPAEEEESEEESDEEMEEEDKVDESMMLPAGL
jgi:hypothetical protein